MAVEAQNPCGNCGAQEFTSDDGEYFLLKKGEDLALSAVGPVFKLLTCQQCGAIRMMATKIAEISLS